MNLGRHAHGFCLYNMVPDHTWRPALITGKFDNVALNRQTAIFRGFSMTLVSEDEAWDSAAEPQR